MTSVLKVDSIQTTSGSGFVIPPAGGIIQTKYKQYDGHTNESMSANTDTELLDNELNPSITPTSTSSIIRIDVQLVFEFSDDEAWNAMFFLYRNGSSGTRLGRAVNGNRNGGIAPPTKTFHGDNDDSTLEYVTFTYFDTPNTTSEVTYTLGARCIYAQNIYINRTVMYDSTNADSHEAGVSMMALTEIAG